MANQGRNWRALSDKLVQVGPKIGNTDGHNGPKINIKWTQWTQDQYDGSWNIRSIAGMIETKLKDSE